MQASRTTVAWILVMIFAASGCQEQEAVNVAHLIDLDGLKCHRVSRKPFTGRAVKYWTSGRKLWEVEWREGKPHGEAITWNKDGQEIAKGEWRRGKRIGHWTFWYDSGQKLLEGEYREGRRNGRWTRWYENGQQQAEIEYLEGRVVGRLEWDREGNLL